MKKYIIISISIIFISIFTFGIYKSLNTTNKSKEINSSTNTPAVNEQVSYDMNSWKNEIPATCKSFFDGCNRCNKIEGDEQNAACTRMACEKYEQPKCLDNESVTTEDSNANSTYDMNSWKKIIPSTCKAFFDGCNQCNRASGDIENAACTMMFCEKYEEPKCLDKQNTSDNKTGISNPAAVYCEEQGGVSKILTNKDGSQSGQCVFSDGRKCDDWQFFNTKTCK